MRYLPFLLLAACLSDPPPPDPHEPATCDHSWADNGFTGLTSCEYACVSDPQLLMPYCGTSSLACVLGTFTTDTGQRGCCQVIATTATFLECRTR